MPWTGRTSLKNIKINTCDTKQYAVSIQTVQRQDDFIFVILSAASLSLMTHSYFSQILLIRYMPWSWPCRHASLTWRPGWYKTIWNQMMTRQMLSSWSQTESFLLMLSPLLFVLILPTFHSRRAHGLGFMIWDNFNYLSFCINYVEIRCISSICQYLTIKATQTLVCAFVLSKLDYYNSLLSGCPLYPLQLCNETSFFKAPKFDHMQPLLQAFHCLSVQAKIDYNLSTICHNFFSYSSLASFPDHLTVYTSSRQLCSSAETWILCIPHVTTKTFGKRCFSYYAPKQCCSFLSDIHRIMPSKLH